MSAGPKLLPTSTYIGSKENGRRIEMPPTKIIRPDAGEVATYAETDLHTCGECKHFEHEIGQARMVAQKFTSALVREHGWKVKHLCHDPDDMGICGLHEGGDTRSKGSTLTGPFSKACDQFQPSRGLMRIRRK